MNGYLHSLPVGPRTGDTAPLPQTYNPLRDILEWSPALVRNWVLGLGSEFKSISSEFYRLQVRGTELLQMGAERLLTLGVSNVSQQETVLLAVELLRNITGAGSESSLVISQFLSVHISQLIQHLCAGESLVCVIVVYYTFISRSSIFDAFGTKEIIQSGSFIIERLHNKRTQFNTNPM